ncbi:MAG: hypothetical protein EZS28_034604, partial [Streblomastix strix]
MAKLFVLLEKRGSGFIVTDEAMQMLLSVPNAVLVIFTSPIRSGKSTCINYLVTGDTTSCYINHPMKVDAGTGDLKQPKQDVIMGIMSLLPVACVCVYISTGQVQEQTLPEIA